jgi:hypothetical protein
MTTEESINETPVKRKRGPNKPKTTLTPADLLMIAEIASTAAAEAVKVAMSAQTKVADPSIVASADPTPEELDTWTVEQIEAFNAKEAKKAAARKARQELNLQKLGGMSTGERAKAMDGMRDPNIIRRATPPGWTGTADELVRVVCKRKTGLANDEMSEPGEVIDMYRPTALKMQETGVIQVQI